MPLSDKAQTWTVTQDSAANTLQTVTKAASGAGVKHYVTGFSAVVSAAAVGAADAAIILKDGSTAKWKEFFGALAVRGARVSATFDPAIEITANAAVNLEIAAGGAAVVTTGNIIGYTQPA